MHGNAVSKEKPSLTEEQRRRIEENRRKALERLQQRRVETHVAARDRLEHSPKPKIVVSSRPEFLCDGTYNLKKIDRPSTEQETSLVIRKQIEEKKAKALGRLTSKHQFSNIRQAAQNDKTSYSKLYSTGSSKGDIYHANQASNLVSAGETDKFSWRDRFSYKKQSPSNLQVDNSKASSLVAKINESSISKVQTLDNSPSSSGGHRPSHTFGEYC